MEDRILFVDQKPIYYLDYISNLDSYLMQTSYHNQMIHYLDNKPHWIQKNHKRN